MQSVSHALIPLHQCAQFDVGQVTGRERDKLGHVHSSARRTPSPLTCAGTAGWTPFHFQDQSSSHAVSEQKEWRCESQVTQGPERHQLGLTASLFSSSLTAWMVSLHSAIRVSYRCSLVSSLDACTEGQFLITTSCCNSF